jgi:hypothetical protein
MKKLLIIFFTCVCSLIVKTNSNAQGCVAIRSTGGICAMNEHPDSAMAGGKNGFWLYNNNDRYYKSFRHFVGKQEQYQRIALHNNVINKVLTQDETFTRVFDERWSLSLDIPFADNSRSQLAGTSRFSTHSFGLGDISATGLYWLFNPAKATQGNVQVGLGIKFATGKDDYEDYFHSSTGTRILAPVDQSIQLGDGGTGVSLSLNAYYNLAPKFGLYGNFFYLANPRDVNGTPTSTTTPANATKIAVTSDVESVPDQYLIRFGGSLAVHRFNFSVGVRDDGLPVRDLFGNSDGFRRPGYVLAAEPGVTYHFKNIALYAYVPIAIIRDRTQSVPDIRQTELTNAYTHGDAAFADYVVNVGVTVKF